LTRKDLTMEYVNIDTSMRTTRLSATQIVYAVKQLKMDIYFTDVSRKYGVREHTIYKKYDHLTPSELQRLKGLERKNTQLKKLVVDVSLDKEIFDNVLRNNSEGTRKRELLLHIVTHCNVSQRRARRLLELSRCRYHCTSRKKDDRALRMRLKDLAYPLPRYPYIRLTVVLNGEGRSVNHKRICHMFVDEWLIVGTKRCKKRVGQRRVRPLPATERAERWSIGFVRAQLADGRSFRLLTARAQVSRENVCLEITQSLPANGVTQAMDRGNDSVRKT
jgi:hypothetical protein